MTRVTDFFLLLAFRPFPNNGSLRRSQFLKYRFRVDPALRIMYKERGYFIPKPDDGVTRR